MGDQFSIQTADLAISSKQCFTSFLKARFPEGAGQYNSKIIEVESKPALIKVDWQGFLCRKEDIGKTEVEVNEAEVFRVVPQMFLRLFEASVDDFQVASNGSRQAL